MEYVSGAEVIEYLKANHAGLFLPEKRPWSQDATAHIQALLGDKFSNRAISAAVDAITKRNRRYIVAGIKNDFCYHIASGTNYTPISSADKSKFKVQLERTCKHPEKFAFYQAALGGDFERILAEVPLLKRAFQANLRKQVKQGSTA